MHLSEDQILVLAPDESSKKSGKELANFSKWSNLGYNEAALWGECQGSGKNPYKTQVDLSNIAFKCTCPSRKFPCKHGLGVLLLYVRQQQLFALAESPDWVKEWIGKREEKAEKKSEKASKPVDAEAQAKRAAQRQKKVEGGMEELHLVLKDIVRNGILTVPEKATTLFDNLSKRMIDAQASGLAYMIRDLAEINYFKENWHTEFLDKLSRIHLISSAFNIHEQLPEPMKEEVRSLIGFSTSIEELKQQSGLPDKWYVLAKRAEQQDQIQIQKTWLLGLNSGKYAQILQFYVKSQSPEINLTPGTFIDAELSFYKSVTPYRAILKNLTKIIPAAIQNDGFTHWKNLIDYEKTLLQLSPFIHEQVYLIQNISLAYANGNWYMKDAEGIALELNTSETTRLRMLAITGGKAFYAIVTGLEGRYLPMAISINDTYQAL